MPFPTTRSTPPIRAGLLPITLNSGFAITVSLRIISRKDAKAPSSSNQKISRCARNDNHNRIEPRVSRYHSKFYLCVFARVISDSELELLGGELDRVDDLRVPRAAADVSRNCFFDIF